MWAVIWRKLGNVTNEIRGHITENSSSKKPPLDLRTSSKDPLHQHTSLFYVYEMEMEMDIWQT